MGISLYKKADLSKLAQGKEGYEPSIIVQGKLRGAHKAGVEKGDWVVALNDSTIAENTSVILKKGKNDHLPNAPERTGDTLTSVDETPGIKNKTSDALH